MMSAQSQIREEVVESDNQLVFNSRHAAQIYANEMKLENWTVAKEGNNYHLRWTNNGTQPSPQTHNRITVEVPEL